MIVFANFEPLAISLGRSFEFFTLPSRNPPPYNFQLTMPTGNQVCKFNLHLVYKVDYKFSKMVLAFKS